MQIFVSICVCARLCQCCSLMFIGLLIVQLLICISQNSAFELGQGWFLCCTQTGLSFDVLFYLGCFREAPQLGALLKEMKDGLDVVRSKVQAITAKVKISSFAWAFEACCSPKHEHIFTFKLEKGKQRKRRVLYCICVFHCSFRMPVQKHQDTVTFLTNLTL